MSIKRDFKDHIDGGLPKALQPLYFDTEGFSGGSGGGGGGPKILKIMVLTVAAPAAALTSIHVYLQQNGVYEKVARAIFGDDDDDGPDDFIGGWVSKLIRDNNADGANVTWVDSPLEMIIAGIVIIGGLYLAARFIGALINAGRHSGGVMTSVGTSAAYATPKLQHV